MNLKQKLLIFFLILPAIAFAHGEDILIVPFITLILTIVFVVFISIVKLGFKHKFVLSAAYFLATFLTYFYIGNIPYRDNRALINLLLISVPVLATVLAHIGLQLLNNRKV